MRAAAKAAYEAYIAGMGQKMRTSPAKPKGKYGWTKPKGARLWDELPEDERDAWVAASCAARAWESWPTGKK